MERKIGSYFSRSIKVFYKLELKSGDPVLNVSLETAHGVMNLRPQSGSIKGRIKLPLFANRTHIRAAHKTL